MELKDSPGMNVKYLYDFAMSICLWKSQAETGIRVKDLQSYNITQPRKLGTLANLPVV